MYHKFQSLSSRPSSGGRVMHTAGTHEGVKVYFHPFQTQDHTRKLSPLRLRLVLLFLWCIISFPQHLLAHRPIFSENAATGPDIAIPISDPDVSQVVYREITQERPQVWLTFTVPKDFDLFIQIGVPKIDRLKTFRPSMVLIGPGLPNEATPFQIPEGMGVLVFPTQEVEKPRVFHEHFTGTDSWILRSETVRLVNPGRYYLVAFSPENQTGKLWLAIGRKESFSLADFIQFPAWRARIRKFHELNTK